ncbi:hypothetical protein KSP40_PGU020964 [Platanthera guangdongensis]|uniref:Uncharacterized protein n=1 Tax=Platanthera guangdongensis TaxID=2320717 RepID=A0ABR2LFE4_9ASPA
MPVEAVDDGLRVGRSNWKLTVKLEVHRRSGCSMSKWKLVIELESRVVCVDGSRLLEATTAGDEVSGGDDCGEKKREGARVNGKTEQSALLSAEKARAELERVSAFAALPQRDLGLPTFCPCGGTLSLTLAPRGCLVHQAAFLCKTVDPGSARKLLSTWNLTTLCPQSRKVGQKAIQTISLSKSELSPLLEHAQDDGYLPPNATLTSGDDVRFIEEEAQVAVDPQAYNQVENEEIPVDRNATSTATNQFEGLDMHWVSQTEPVMQGQSRSGSFSLLFLWLTYFMLTLQPLSSGPWQFGVSPQQMTNSDSNGLSGFASTRMREAPTEKYWKGTKRKKESRFPKPVREKAILQEQKLGGGRFLKSCKTALAD